VRKIWALPDARRAAVSETWPTRRGGLLRTRFFWGGVAVVFIAAAVALLGSAQARQVTASAATSTPVGLWRVSTGTVYRWVAITGGYQEQFERPHTLANSCPAYAGDTVGRFYATGDELYRAVRQVWRGVCVRWRCGRCTRHLEPGGIVRIVVAGDRLTVSCPNTPGQVCETYTRAHD
jgi:hypothetical protein